MNGLVVCTRGCNLRCAYCFECDGNRERQFSEGVGNARRQFEDFIERNLGEYVSQLVELNKKMGRNATVLTFHGGEPLLVGHDLLRRALKVVCDFDGVQPSIQTNGVLIDDDYVELFLEYGVSVGVSIDGDKETHDLYRTTSSGRGTYEKVVRAIKILKSAGVSVGGLATITNDGAERAAETYRAFKELELDFTMNPCTRTCSDGASIGSCSSEEYASFCKTLFDIWINDKEGAPSISYFENIINSLAILDSPWMGLCYYIPSCATTTIAIDQFGMLYRCLHYCLDEKNSFGSISDTTLDSIAFGKSEYNDRWEYLSTHDCKECDIIGHCYGGCPYAAELENGTMRSRPQACESHKAVVHHIYNHLASFCK